MAVRRPLAAALVATALAVLALAPVTRAATFRVDDAATLVENTVVKMRWRNVAPSRRTDNAMLGTTRVNVRLHLAPWQHRNARLYLVLPAQPPGPLVARWTTQGRLQPGEVVSGRRTLVYAGPVTTAVLDEMLLLELETDGQQLESLHRIDFHFEIDVE
jgi:hypothetical protein